MRPNIQKYIRNAVELLVIGVVVVSGVMAQDSQKAVASKTAKFATVSKTDEAYKKALDAHDLEGARLQAGKDGLFRGTVTQVFTPRSGTIAILNFDKDYKTALTAVVNKSFWAKFPDLTELVGKEVVITGKFTDFHGAMQIVLNAPNQIGVVQK